MITRNPTKLEIIQPHLRRRCYPPSPTKLVVVTSGSICRRGLALWYSRYSDLHDKTMVGSVWEPCYKQQKQGNIPNWMALWHSCSWGLKWTLPSSSSAARMPKFHFPLSSPFTLLSPSSVNDCSRTPHTAGTQNAKRSLQEKLDFSCPKN